MRVLLRHRQPVVHGISRPIGGRYWIKNAHYAWLAGLGEKGAMYDYAQGTAAITPTIGQVYWNTAGLWIKIHEIDKKDKNWGQVFSIMQAGDIFIVGTVEGILASPPGVNTGVWQLPMVSWTGLANGEYRVRARFAEAAPSPGTQIGLNTDGDSLPDTLLANLPGGGSVTIDDDSINIDTNGDGVADVVVPR